MKDRLSKNSKDTTANVEFGIEFGDINGAKLVEYPFMNQDQQIKNKKKKK